jgi:hypothetical protein
VTAPEETGIVPTSLLAGRARFLKGPEAAQPGFGCGWLTLQVAFGHRSPGSISGACHLTGFDQNPAYSR